MGAAPAPALAALLMPVAIVATFAGVALVKRVRGESFYSFGYGKL